MNDEIIMKWTGFVNGTTHNTVFYGQEWVKTFSEFETPLEAAKFFNKHFEGSWRMTAYEIPDVDERKASSWDERYAMMCLFKGYVHPTIRLYLTKEELAALNLDYFNFYDYELHSQWMLFRTEFTPKGNIAVVTSLAAPHPDSDDDYIFRIYTPNGKPLTNWQRGWQPLFSSGYYELKDKY